MPALCSLTFQGRRSGATRPTTVPSNGCSGVKVVRESGFDTAIEVNPHILDGVKVKLNYATNEFDVTVANLIMNITEKALNDYFLLYGKLQSCEIKENINSHHNYQRDQQFSVYIGNIPFDATDDLLFDYFKIVHWHVKRDQNTSRALGYGFVSFEKAEQAIQAVNDGPHFLNGKTLRVAPAKTLTLSKKSFK
ncbi:RNA recognition motif domain-containing protein [Ditylenchus destructor]|nr:RNA recognition motif domain-containing protein [Ditylenchus destructor]